MKPILFITGDKDELQAVSAFIPGIQGIDLTEIQELDARKSIAVKLTETQKDQTSAFIVEDTPFCWTP